MNPGLPIWDNVADFAVMLLAGIAVSAFFDIQRSARRAVRKNGGKNPVPWVMLQDLFFAVISFFFLVLVIYRINEGIIRSYIVIGFAAGVVFYAALITKLAGKVFYGIFYGFYYIVMGGKRFAVKILCKIRTLIKKIFKKVPEK